MSEQQKTADTSSHPVFADWNALDIDDTPDELVERDEEVEKVVNCLSPLCDGSSPWPLHLFGPEGTGKTATIKWALDQLAEAESATEEYVVRHVDCSSAETPQTLVRMLINAFRDPSEELGPVTPHATSTLIKILWTEIEAYGNDPDDRTPVLLVLDGVDNVSDLDEVVYRLNRTPELDTVRVGTIWVSRKADVFADLGEKSERSFRRESVFFAPYTPSEVRQILGERVEKALQDTTVLGTKGNFQIKSDVLTQEALDRAAKATVKTFDSDVGMAFKISRQAEKKARPAPNPCITVEEVEAVIDDLAP